MYNVLIHKKTIPKKLYSCKEMIFHLSFPNPSGIVIEGLLKGLVREFTTLPKIFL